jgi:hypothetical protein
MSIRFSCSCGRKLKVSDEKIGMKVLCSSCGATLKVPKKSQDEYWQDVPGKGGENQVDYIGGVKDFLFRILPGGVVLALICYLAYFLSSHVVVGRGNLPPLAKVTGDVTINGKPLTMATIRFVPLDETNDKERKGASVSMGLTNESGHYSLLYVKDVPGAILGKSRVQIEARDQFGNERVRPEFNRTSTLVRNVEKNDNVFDFDVQEITQPNTTSSGAGAQ